MAKMLTKGPMRPKPVAKLRESPGYELSSGSKPGPRDVEKPFTWLKRVGLKENGVREPRQNRNQKNSCDHVDLHELSVPVASLSLWMMTREATLPAGLKSERLFRV